MKTAMCVTVFLSAFYGGPAYADGFDDVAVAARDRFSLGNVVFELGRSLDAARGGTRLLTEMDIIYGGQTSRGVALGGAAKLGLLGKYAISGGGDFRFFALAHTNGVFEPAGSDTKELRVLNGAATLGADLVYRFVGVGALYSFENYCGAYASSGRGGLPDCSLPLARHWVAVRPSFPGLRLTSQLGVALGGPTAPDIKLGYQFRDEPAADGIVFRNPSVLYEAFSMFSDEGTHYLRYADDGLLFGDSGGTLYAMPVDIRVGVPRLGGSFAMVGLSGFAEHEETMTVRTNGRRREIRFKNLRGWSIAGSVFLRPGPTLHVAPGATLRYDLLGSRTLDVGGLSIEARWNHIDDLWLAPTTENLVLFSIVWRLPMGLVESAGPRPSAV